MRNGLACTLIVGGLLITGGCATKKYVRQTTDPINARVSEVATKEGSDIAGVRKDMERDETELSATKERAASADSRATDALGRADKAGEKADSAGQKAEVAGQKADKNSHDLGELRQTVSNLDDYKVAAAAVVPFGFNKDNLTKDAKAQIDQLVSAHSSLKRYFIAVKGFTDKTGPTGYNEALSRRRAERVMEYLVAAHDIPVYRIHMVGLGKEKPADEGRGRAAMAKNRRVEVTFYTADAAVAGITPAQTDQAAR